MSQNAIGLAKLVELMATTDWAFANEVGLQILEGGWARSGHTITWAGDAPEMTNTEATNQDAKYLKVAFDEDPDPTYTLYPVCVIPHPPVTLEPDEKIIYTSVEVSFYTEAFPT